MKILLLFLVLCIGHFIADYIMQLPGIQRGKNRNRPIDLDSIPPGQTPATVWPWVLSAHAAGHAGMVLVITLNGWMMIAEFLTHWLIDYHKCGNRFGNHTDQSLHLAVKLAFALVFAFGWAPLPFWLSYVTF